jgi:hypothetical protein
MNPEMMIALARISEVKHQLCQPMWQHRYQANQRRIAAGRARRERWLKPVGRAIRMVVGGARTGRTVATT